MFSKIKDSAIHTVQGVMKKNYPLPNY